MPLTLEPERYEVQETSRLDQFLVSVRPTWHRLAVRELITNGEVLVNGDPALKPGQRVHTGDEVVVPGVAVDPRPEPEFHEPFALSVIYEDEALLVLDKPAGIPTHAKRYAEGATLASLLASAYPEMAHVGGIDRSGIVQRMETEVSGLLLAARAEEVYRTLKRAVKRQQVQTRYSVLVEGQLSGEGEIDAPLGNVKRSRQRRLRVVREGRTSITHYRALRTYQSEGRAYTLLDVQPDSGRLHQIRVHLAWMGTPVVGDRIYGTSRQWLLPDRIFMHLGWLTFPHPLSGELQRVEAFLPEELSSILRFMARPKP